MYYIYLKKNSLAMPRSFPPKSGLAASDKKNNNNLKFSLTIGNEDLIISLFSHAKIGV